MNNLKNLFIMFLVSACASVSTIEIKKTDYQNALGNKKSLETAQVTPVFDEVKNIRGFRIQSFAPRSPLLIFRLIEGDILIDVNGEALTSLRTAKKLLLQAPDFAVLNVTFEREGEKYTYRYKVVH